MGAQNAKTSPCSMLPLQEIYKKYIEKDAHQVYKYRNYTLKRCRVLLQSNVEVLN